MRICFVLAASYVMAVEEGVWLMNMMMLLGEKDWLVTSTHFPLHSFHAIFRKSSFDPIEFESKHFTVD